VLRNRSLFFFFFLITLDTDPSNVSISYKGSNSAGFKYRSQTCIKTNKAEGEDAYVPCFLLLVYGGAENDGVRLACFEIGQTSDFLTDTPTQRYRSDVHTVKNYLEDGQKKRSHIISGFCPCGPQRSAGTPSGCVFFFFVFFFMTFDTDPRRPLRLE